MSVCKISYEDFLLSLKQELELYLGEDYVVEHKQVIKNNGISLDGFLIRSFNESVIPNIYVNQYYEQLMSGRRLETIVQEIISTYEACRNEAMELSNDFSYEFAAIKYRITFRLINYEKNKQLLKQVPHFRFLDLAVTFHCLVRNNEDEIGSVRVTNEHMVYWKVTAETLWELAVKNTRRLFPPVLRPMEDLIFDLMSQNQEQDEKELHEFMNRNKPCGMYVLTNSKGINGASCLLFREVLKSFQEQTMADYYILPSSIHEVILVPYKEGVTIENGIKRERLLQMVEEINETKVAAKEVLADNVYDNRQVMEAIDLLRSQYKGIV